MLQPIEANQSAQSVAIYLLLLQERHEWKDLIPLETFSLTRQFLNHTETPLKPLLDRSWFRSCLHRLINWTIPHFPLYLGVRKRWIENQVQQALHQDFRQVVILGAGFDPLAYRYHKIYSDVHWLEIDHPHTSIDKQLAIQTQGDQKENLSFLPMELSNSYWEDSLLESGRYQPDLKTLFIAEGLLMYLSTFDVRYLIETFTQHSQTGSRLIGTSLAPLSSGKLIFPTTQKWRAYWQSFWPQKPYQWGISPEQLPDFLKKLGYHQIETVDPSSLLFKWTQRQIPLPKGEYFFVAQSLTED